jgi:hypothetical protein
MVRLAPVVIAALALAHVARADAKGSDPPANAPPNQSPSPPADPPAAAAPAPGPAPASPPAASPPPAGPIAATNPPAGAATETPEPVHGQRMVGIGAEIGFNTGLGAALHLGMPKIGLYVAGGIMPLFVVGNENNASRSLTFDVYRAFALNIDLYAMPFQGSSRSNFGFCVGYSGNTILGNGLNLGIALRKDLGEKVAFTLFGGFEIFPDARDRLAAHGYPSDRDPPIPQLQGGVNFGLVIYP